MNAVQTESNFESRPEQTGCHVLMNSRRYGTSAFLCESIEEAVRTLAWLARRAEEARQVDGVQRFFCLAASDTTEQPSVDAFPDCTQTPDEAATIVVCLDGKTLHWIAGDNLDARPLVVLEALGGPAEGQFLYWEAWPRPLAELDPVARHCVCRFLDLRRMRPADPPDRPREANSACIDPVVSSWQRENPDSVLPPLHLFPGTAGEEGAI